MVILLRDVMSPLASRCDSFSDDSTTEIMVRLSANLRINEFLKDEFYGEKSKESSQKMPGKAIKYGQILSKAKKSYRKTEIPRSE